MESHEASTSGFTPYHDNDQSLDDTAHSDDNPVGLGEQKTYDRIHGDKVSSPIPDLPSAATYPSTAADNKLSAPSQDDTLTCRVCRTDDSSAGPLYHPCRCSGSIAYCHQDCLATWLAHSKKATCELCGHKFTFVNVYHPGTPSRPPLTVILSAIVEDCWNTTILFCRAALVMISWLAVVPWAVAFAMRMGLVFGDWLTRSFTLSLPFQPRHLSTSAMTPENVSMSENGGFHLLSVPHRNSSIFAITSDGTRPIRDAFNVMAFDIVQGQLITCAVVISVVFVFMLREYIIQIAPEDVVADEALERLRARQAVVAALALKQSWNADNVSTFYALSVRLADLATFEDIEGPVLSAFILPRLKDELEALINGQGNQDTCILIASGALQRNRDDALELTRIVLSRFELLQDVVDHAQGEVAMYVDIWRRLQKLELSLSVPAAPVCATAQEGVTAVFDDLMSVSTHKKILIHPVNAPVLEALRAARLMYNLDFAHYAIARNSMASNAVLIDSFQKVRMAILERLADCNLYLHLLTTPAFQEVPDVVMGFKIDRVAFGPRLDSMSHEPPRLGLDIPNTSTYLDAASTSGVPISPSLAFRHLDPGNELPFTSQQESRSSTPDSAWESIDSNETFDGSSVDIPAPEPALPVAPMVEEPILPIPLPEVEDHHQPAVEDLGDGEVEEPFQLDDLDGVWEVIGMKGSLFILFQNVGGTILALSALLILFVHVPHVIGKLVVLSRAHRIAGIPLHGLFILQNHAHSLLDRLAGAVVRLVPSGVSSSVPSLRSSAITESASKAILMGFKTELSLVFRQVSDRFTRIPTGTLPSDRTLAISFGYGCVIMAGLGYLGSGVDQERARFVGQSAVRFVQQQFVLLKVAFFITIELLVFPLICGLLLNFTTMSVFPGVDVASRIEQYERMPNSMAVMTWLAGTVTMFVFAVLVGACRSTLRAGVCWWIRDPADPRFHPIRDILNRPALVQLQKVGTSAIMYACIIVFGISSVVWSLRIFTGILPLRVHLDRPWTSTAADIVLYQSVLPLALDYFEPRQYLLQILEVISRRTARCLQVDEFLYKKVDEEQNEDPFSYREEEVAFERRSPRWQERLPFAIFYDVPQDVQYRTDTAYLRVPKTDAVKVVPRRKMHVRVNEVGWGLDEEDHELIVQQLSEAAADTSTTLNDYYMVVKIPDKFALHLIGWSAIMWAVCIFFMTVVIGAPLIVGRSIVDSMTQVEQHDAYSYAVGAVVCAALWQLSGLAKSMYQKAQAHREEPTLAPNAVEDMSVTHTSQPLWTTESPRSGSVLATLRNRGVAFAERHAQLWVLLHRFVVVADCASVIALFGFVLPILSAINMELYFLAPLRYASTHEIELVPKLYVADSWMYGVLYLKLFSQLTRIGTPNRFSRTQDEVASAWNAQQYSDAVRLANRSIALKLAALLCFTAVAPAVTFLPVLMFTPPKLLAPLIRAAGWDALSKTDRYHVLVKSLYPGLLSWASHYQTSKLCARRVSLWMAHVKDRKFLRHRRLQNYERNKEVPQTAG